MVLGLALPLASNWSSIKTLGPLLGVPRERKGGRKGGRKSKELPLVLGPVWFFLF